MFDLGRVALLSLLALLVLVLCAARNIRRRWQEEPPSARRLWWEKTFCTPILWVAFFRWWMRRKLERNPVGWLELRTWTGRVVTWSWFAVMISLYSVALTEGDIFRAGFGELQKLMAWLLVGSIVMSAAGSFRRERETGVLELLLVTPLSVGEIIGGRLRGLWGQFLPAMAVLLGIWFYFANLFGERGQMERIWFYGISFLTLPVVGLYFSLHSRSTLAAALWTLAVGVILPVALAGWVDWLLADMHYFFRRQWRLSVGATVLQIVFAVFLWRQLYDHLSRRTFRLERTVM